MKNSPEMWLSFLAKVFGGAIAAKDRQIGPEGGGRSINQSISHSIFEIPSTQNNNCFNPHLIGITA